MAFFLGAPVGTSSTPPASGVQSVSGNIVNNIDPTNPVVTQVQPDWNATSGLGEILNKPTGLLTNITSPVSGLVTVDPDDSTQRIINAGSLALQNSDGVKITAGVINGTNIGLTSPNSFSVFETVTTVVAPTYTLVVPPTEESDCSSLILTNSSTPGNYTLSSAASGFSFETMNLNASPATWALSGGGTISGSPTFNQNESGKLVCNGSNNWVVLRSPSNNAPNRGIFTYYLPSASIAFYTIASVYTPYNILVDGMACFASSVGGSELAVSLYQVAQNANPSTRSQIIGGSGDFFFFNEGSQQYPQYTAAGGDTANRTVPAGSWFQVGFGGSASGWAGLYLEIHYTITG